MNTEEYAALLGKIFMNIRSIEFAMRLALYKHKSKPYQPFLKGFNLNTLTLGDDAPENSLTDFSSLKELIDRYNTEIANGNQTPPIDPNLIELRDALAHGRISTNTLESPLKLLKFDKPHNKKVRVAFAQDLTQDWLKKQLRWTCDELLKATNKTRNDIIKTTN